MSALQAAAWIRENGWKNVQAKSTPCQEAGNRVVLVRLPL